jgi:hypothetical protein
MKKSILLGLFLALLINMQSFGVVTFIMNNYLAQEGTDITIPVKVTGFNNVMSIQGTVQFDQTKLTYSSVQDYTLLTGMVPSGFGTTQVNLGILTFSWMDPGLAGLTLPDSSTIFSITFHVIGTAGQVCPLTFVNAPTPFEVIDPTMSPVSYALINGSVSIYSTVSIPDIQASGFQVFQNEPNPFTNETRFAFSLPEDGKVSIDIYYMPGNKVKSVELEFKAGNRIYNLNAAKLQSGTYFYRISCGKYSEIRKMLVVK